jgi:ribose transport system ATP-binding protein
MMRTLKEQGVSIIFISHKLNEVMEICDRYTVLRDGNMVAEGLVKDTSSMQLAAHMVGHEVSSDVLKRDAALGDVVLELDKLSDGKNFEDISLSVKAGEILGVTGLLGDGRSELFQTVFGAAGSKYTGRILLEGKEIHPTNTHQALDNGIAYLPRNRKENAIIKDMSILDNGSIVMLSKLKKGIFIDFDKQEELFKQQEEELRIKMGSQYDLITSLSGGNQQKVVLAKWLMSEPKLLILDNPTQGVDVGAKEEIYHIIHRLAAQGVAIIVLSSEAQEIIRVCDRTLVLFHGKQVGELIGEEMTETGIMYLATGGNQNESES